MKKTILFFCSFLCFKTLIFAQTFTISGYIEDDQSGERLIGASIYDANTKIGTCTNNFGFYSISFPEDQELDLHVSYIGYETQSISIKVEKDISINFVLKYNNTIEEVEIVADRNNKIENRTEIGTIQISMEDVKILPSLTGEKDIMRVYQLMPGVQTGSEGSAGLYVRGGSPDQNLILLDDIPLYYVYHLGGFYSVFDPDVIKSTKLVKGGFSARYGGRISSVFDIRMNDGNKKTRSETFSIGLLATKYMIEGPLRKDTTSAVFSIRRSNIDLFTRIWSKIQSSNSLWAYSFYDIYTKVNRKFSDSDQAFLSFYIGRDNIYFKDTDFDSYLKYETDSKIKWGNILGSIRWNHKYNARLYSNLTFAHTRFRYSTEFESTNREQASNRIFSQNTYSFLSDVNDFILKVDFDYYPNSKNIIKFGASSVFHTFKPSLTKSRISNNSDVFSDTTVKADAIYALENAAYAEDQLTINDRVSINAGLHFSTYHLIGNSYFFLQPRLLSNVKISKKSSLKLSYSRMVQYVHLLSRTGGGLPADLWVPSTDLIKPLNSNLYSLAFVKSFDKPNLELSVETFYKTMSNLIEYKEGALLFGGSNNWQSKIETGGIGRSYGAEFLIKKNYGKSTGWISYYLSRTERQFNSINDGNPFLYKYDRTHDISIVYSRNLNDHIQFSTTWVFTSGNMMTLAVSKYDLINFDYQDMGDNPFKFDEVHIYDGRNTFRLPAYHRLDVGFNFVKQKKKGLRTWSVGIYNVYNRKNPYYVFLKVENGAYKLYQQSLFPIMPYFNYSFNFSHNN